MTGPVDPSAKPYRRWLDLTERMLRPLAGLMRPGKAGLDLQGPASDHGHIADVLESFARPCLLAAHWLQAESPGDQEDGVGLSRHEVADWLRRGLLLGTDPSGPEYWGPTTNTHQHTVEMAALVLALEMARSWLWEPLSSPERAQVARWMGSVRGSGLHRNNHLFFGVLPLSFLHKEGFGRPSDLPCVQRWLDILEGMSLGGGWFIDGMNESVDHYNAYAFHYYGLWWGRLFGELDPARAGRWRDWTREFLGDYVHFFAASGEPVPFGRSMAYRFAASAPFALAEWCGASPLPPGQARRLCTRSLEFFLNGAVTQSQGALSLGWTDEFPALAEPYSCAGSPYWAAKGLAPLLLPPKSPFWTDPEQPLPCETADTARPILSAGLVVRGHHGEVELLNAATSISVSNTRYGPWKWGKFSYRTGMGLEIGYEGTPDPLDAALTAEATDSKTYHRQSTHPLRAEADRLGCIYVLGHRLTQFSVQIETDLWWRGGWQLHFHRYTAHQRCRLRLGAQSLSADHPQELTDDGDFTFWRARNATHGVVLQPLAGLHSTDARRTVAGQEPRVHLRAADSLALYLQTDWLPTGEGWLAALVWAGKIDELPAAPWKIESTPPGRWTFTGPDAQTWTVSDAVLPALA